MKKNIGNALIACSVVIILIGFILCCVGFSKKDNYDIGENMYVGGDAYNYIINGTYFAGYCALGGALLVSGTLVGLCGAKYMIDYRCIGENSPRNDGSDLPEI